MFLKNKGASGQFTFDIIYSCLQKSLRRNDYELSMEMVKEFRDYPNALKKRLIYICCEDLPNLYLIKDIYDTEADINKLLPFIKIICEHIKCREVIMAFRVACQDKINKEPFNKDDDLYTWCQKLFTQLCKYDSDCKPVLDELIRKFPILNEFKITNIFNFINKNRVVLYSIIAFLTIDYITIKKYIPDNFNNNIPFDFNFKKLTLPDYVYDKHVKISPESQKTYKFFMDNIILIPRKPETDLEVKGKNLYIATDKASGEYINKIRYDFGSSEIKKYNFKDLRLIQTQLITGRSKPRTWFCCNLNKVIKGPLNIKQIKELIDSDKLKRIFKLKRVHTEIIEIDGEFYLMFDNLIPINENETIVKSSKLETNVTIYNGNLYVLSSKEFSNLSDNVKLKVIKNLIFRKIIGTNDTCDRNIIVYKNKVASIDDPVLLQETEFMFKTHIVNTQVRTSYEDAYEKNKKIIDDWLQEIRNKINNKKGKTWKFILNKIDNLEIKF